MWGNWEGNTFQDIDVYIKNKENFDSLLKSLSENKLWADLPPEKRDEAMTKLKHDVVYQTLQTAITEIEGEPAKVKWEAVKRQVRKKPAAKKTTPKKVEESSADEE
ncbi:uncharacterized protein EV422DRAFT_503445 [Fimicolochytrium jonesii]|uniref:uncharacterized protein n=1 Tax=Fimicolochytrium jonesii TaxID=1396493 RepID=UPI0022FE757F|nr:uncharacterized protein EV422DRAFT_503445 [Fimicolochytrium jonesii]KAI8826127.1 hypothetical protein EV422DRAFT_503445 [Fimicolochytrium jonesii]